MIDSLLAGKPIDGETRFDIAPEGANLKSSTPKSGAAR